MNDFFDEEKQAVAWPALTHDAIARACAGIR